MSYTKGKATKLSSNFDSTEFDCHGSGCCSTTEVDPKLVEYLQKIRDHFGVAIDISSGYRCESHNKKVGGVTGSYHTKGQAADIYSYALQPVEIAQYAEAIGIKGIGLYDTDSDGHFVHIDTRTTKAFWYGQKEESRSTFGGTANGAMKYSAANPPMTCMMTNSTCYKGTSKMTIKGILWHSTGANNPNLKRYVQPSKSDKNYSSLIAKIGKNNNGNDWNSISVQAGLNAWIGKLANGSVTTLQTMPWNYKPWGCGGGSRGSCNNGWIQFEICEDGLSDSTYFSKVYEEACQLTAYLCKLYNIDPNGKVSYGGKQVPTILCHNDAYYLGLGSGHADVTHWFPKHGKSMATARARVTAILKSSENVPEASPSIPETTELYRIRKSWEDAKTQKGAYKSLESAKAACDKAGGEYKVFNSKGEIVYPINEKPVDTEFKVGSMVSVLAGATYTSGKDVPNWVISTPMYIRRLDPNDACVISTVKTGPVTGVVNKKFLIPYDPNNKPKFEPYYVRITMDEQDIYKTSKGGTVVAKVKAREVYTIVAEENGYGQLKSKIGWLDISKTKKLSAKVE